MNGIQNYPDKTQWFTVLKRFCLMHILKESNKYLPRKRSFPTIQFLFFFLKYKKRLKWPSNTLNSYLYKLDVLFASFKLTTLKSYNIPWMVMSEVKFIWPLESCSHGSKSVQCIWSFLVPVDVLAPNARFQIK